MAKQNINIVGIPILYNILEEIKDNLSFKVVNFSSTDNFLKFLNENKLDKKNFFIITSINNKDFFLKTNFFNVKKKSILKLNVFDKLSKLKIYKLRYYFLQESTRGSI